MKAVICRAYGEPVLDEVPKPEPGKNEVRVAVKSAGVSYIDVLIASGKYQVKPPLPFIPGTEFAGVIDAVGEGVSTERIGQRVIGGGFIGGYTEFAVCHTAAARPLPDGASFDEALALSTNFATALHAFKDRAELKPGESVLVLGAAGGTGSAAIAVAKAMGARVIAAASTETKRAFALDCGADATVDPDATTFRDAIKAFAGPQGLGAVFDPVGGPYTETAFRCLGWRGRHLIVGFTAGMTSLPTNLPLLKGAALMGVDLARFAPNQPELARENSALLFTWLAEGKIKPSIGAHFPMARFADAFAHVETRAAMGKVILEIA